MSTTDQTDEKAFDGRTDPAWPEYPLELPTELYRNVYRLIDEAWRLLAPYRLAAGGPHKADGEIPGQLLVFMHTVQPSIASKVAGAVQLMITGAERYASESAPDDGWAPPPAPQPPEEVAS